jgi:hypothetical protein
MKKHISFLLSDFLNVLISRKKDYFTIIETADMFPEKDYVISCMMYTVNSGSIGENFRNSYNRIPI